MRQSIWSGLRMIKFPDYRAFSLTYQYSCVSIKTKNTVCIRIQFIPYGLVWNTNMAAVSLFWYTNMAAVTSGENALYMKLGWNSSLRIANKVQDRFIEEGFQLIHRSVIDVLLTSQTATAPELRTQNRSAVTPQKYALMYNIKSE